MAGESAGFLREKGGAEEKWKKGEEMRLYSRGGSC